MNGKWGSRRRRRMPERSTDWRVMWKRYSLLECELICVFEHSRILNPLKSFNFLATKNFTEKVAQQTLEFYFEIKLPMCLWAGLGGWQKLTAHNKQTFVWIDPEQCIQYAFTACHKWDWQKNILETTEPHQKSNQTLVIKMQIFICSSLSKQRLCLRACMCLNLCAFATAVCSRSPRDSSCADEW